MDAQRDPQAYLSVKVQRTTLAVSRRVSAAGDTNSEGAGGGAWYGPVCIADKGVLLLEAQGCDGWQLTEFGRLSGLFADVHRFRRCF